MTIAAMDRELLRQIDPGDLPPPASPPMNPFPDIDPDPHPPRTKTFQIRCTGGYSFGVIVVAKMRLDFDIYDAKNNLTSEYRLVGLTVGIATPISWTECGPVTDFETVALQSTSSFEGPATLESAGSAGNNTSWSILQLALLAMNIRVSTGYTNGIDLISINAGYFRLVDTYPGRPKFNPLARGSGA